MRAHPLYTPAVMNAWLITDSTNLPFSCEPLQHFVFGGHLFVVFTYTPVHKGVGLAAGFVLHQQGFGSTFARLATGFAGLAAVEFRQLLAQNFVLLPIDFHLVGEGADYGVDLSC